MRSLCFAFALLFAGGALAWAFDEPQEKPAAKEDEDKNVADQIQAAQMEFNTKQRDVIRRYRATDDDAERQKILLEYRGLQSELTSKLAAIVDKQPEDEAIFPALEQLISSPDHAAKAVEILLKHHVDNTQIGTFCLQLGMQENRDSEPLLRAVAEKSKNSDAKAMALLGLGQMLLSQSNNGDLDDAQRGKLREQAQTALKTVVAKYPNVEAFNRKAGNWASAVLFEVENLAVGLPVPDLTGEDLEGEEFKLSDYRGKVVFLDFWAHW
jgi:hypothetical protein